MADCRTEPFRLHFERRLRLQFQGATVASDERLLADRELDDAFDLNSIAANSLDDNHTGQNSEYGLAELFRRVIYRPLDR